MNRKKVKINRYLAQSRRAYKKSRSTAEIICAHRLITDKTQIQDTTIYVTDIDISIAFDKIQRDQLINRA